MDTFHAVQDLGDILDILKTKDLASSYSTKQTRPKYFNNAKNN